MDRKEKKGVPWREGIATLWLVSERERGRLLLMAIFAVLSAAGYGAVPYLVGRFFDALASGSTAVYGAFFLWFGTQVVSASLETIGTYVSSSVETRLQLEILHRGLTKLLRLPMAYHKKERMGDILSTVSRAGWMCTNAINSTLSIGPQLLSVVIGLAIAFVLNVQLALVLVLGAFVYSCVLVYVIRDSGDIFRRGHDAWSKAEGDVSSAALFVESVKSAAAEEYEEKKAEKAFFIDAFTPWIKMERIWNTTGLFQRGIVITVQAFILFSSIWLVSRGTLTIGELIAFNGYGIMFLGPFARFGNQWHSIQNAIVSAAKLKRTVFDIDSERYEPIDAKPLPTMRGDVRFDHVSFRYSDSSEDTLKDVSFSVKAGETVAFVGESGVGKSTLVSLIQAFYFPTNGSIFIDDIDTRSLNLTELRLQIAIVPQEVALFNDTVEVNITYGSFDATKEEIKRAAELARAREFISRLPHGYDTIVGERGVKLSVGQKQRIAIARALLRDPAILILDEPTSALDSKTEKELTASLETLMEGRTTFIIAHRLSTVRKADKIIVIQEGTVAEIGSHKELIAKEDGVYRMLYEHQVGLRE